MFGRETFSSIRAVAQEAAEGMRSVRQDLPAEVRSEFRAQLEPVTETTLDTLEEWQTAAQAVTIAAYAVAVGIVGMCTVIAYLAIRDHR